jgi:uncharacterized membrane protein YbhN (UPF0104 family)
LKEKIISFLKSLLFLSIGVGLVWWVVKDLSKEEINQIKDSFKDVNYFWLLMAGMMAFFSHLSRSMRWKILLPPCSHKNQVLWW